MERSRIISTFFGAGEFPIVPGTFASLLAIPIHVFGLAHLTLPFRAGVIAGIFLVGTE
ncbi:MAG: hypothetical protein NTZ26_00255 [Candidatus Aminicenantes bacterium]|nr:hypothetical protein [Candidatus Aminicenantes bacterium]